MDCLFGILTSSKETEERFGGLIEMVAPKGREPSRHLHHTDDEGFYVLDGDVTFYIGEETYKVGPGTSVCLPPGAAHSYTFEIDAVRMLCITAPGRLEAHYQDARFSEPARALTLPPPAEESEMATVEEMARDLANLRHRGGRSSRTTTERVGGALSLTGSNVGEFAPETDSALDSPAPRAEDV